VVAATGLPSELGGSSADVRGRSGRTALHLVGINSFECMKMHGLTKPKIILDLFNYAASRAQIKP
jgi:hypothetical protein